MRDPSPSSRLGMTARAAVAVTIERVGSTESPPGGINLIMPANPAHAKWSGSTGWSFAKFVPGPRLTPSCCRSVQLEAHGVIPNGTDIIAPVAIARAIAPMVNAMIAPVVPYGFTGILDAYPGSFTVPEPVYREYVRAVLIGLAGNQFKNIILLNGHGGGQTAILSGAGAGSRTRNAHENSRHQLVVVLQRRCSGGLR